MTTRTSRIPELVGATLVLLALAACRPERAEPVAVGARMPEFALELPGGETLTSDSLAGAPAVISFWATWCQPCLKDIPELNELVADGMAVVAIALDEGGWAIVEPFRTEHSLRATVVVGDEKLFRRFGGFTIPYTLVVDDAQIIRAIYRGPITRGEVRASLATTSAQ